MISRPRVDSAGMAKTKHCKVTIDRPVYTEHDVSELLRDDIAVEQQSVFTRWKHSVTCRKTCDSLLSFLPIITWLQTYSVKTSLVSDLSAGLTLGVFQIPQGLAYGMLTTLPAVYGLYASFIPVLVYVFTGTSKHLSVGTFAIISLMVGELVENSMSTATLPLNATQSDLDALRVQYAVTASFLVGVFQILLGVLHFGFITTYLSDPLISGFTTGAAFHVFSSQLKHFLGMSIPRATTAGLFKLFKLYYYVFANITEVKFGALIVGAVCTILLFCIKLTSEKFKLKVPIPAELIVVALGTGLSYGFNFHERFDIPILKTVPRRFPPFSTPVFGGMADMAVECFVIAIVSFAISISIAKNFAKKKNYRVDPNQELYAYGIMNIVGSFFSCFTASGSLSRSAIHFNLGSTQITSLISSMVVLLAMMVLAPIFEPLPNAMLAAIVLVALKGLFKQFSVVKPLWKVSKQDTLVWICSFLAVICFNVDYGLAIAICINLAISIIKTSRPVSTELKNLKGTELYVGSSTSLLDEIAGVKIFQYRAPLYYANVEHFQTQLYQRTINPNFCSIQTIEQSTNNSTNNSETGLFIGGAEYKADQNGNKKECSALLKNFVHTVILDCSQTSFSDSMGVNTLKTIAKDFDKVEVDFLLSHCSGEFLDILDRGGFVEDHGAHNLFVTTHDAVQYAQSKKHDKGATNESITGSKEIKELTSLDLEGDTATNTAPEEPHM